jgi:hypothetical protein
VRSVVLLTALATLGCSGPVANRAKPEPKPPPTRPGPGCEALGTAEDCSPGMICCPLPPTMSTYPRCLPDCRGPALCGEVLGPGADCNLDDGCSFARGTGLARSGGSATLAAMVSAPRIL